MVKVRLGAESSRWVSELRAFGVSGCHIDDLGMSLDQLQQGRRVRRNEQLPANEWDVRNHSYEAKGVEILDQVPELYRMGTNPILLNTAEAYFEREPILFDVTYRCDFPSQGQLGVRRWHRDREADTMFKAIVYLSDVGPDDGGFEYIPRGDTPWRPLFWVFPSAWRHSDRAMRKLVSARKWHKYIGVAGSVVLTDTAAVYHHGTNPVVTREVVTFTYVPVSNLNVLKSAG